MMQKNETDRLSSLDSHGSRRGIYPAAVHGVYRKWRTRVHLILFLVFLALPWISIRGHQAILLNIPSREFNFFGLLFRAHDAPLVFLLLAILVMGLGLVTSLWGRVWCGWACPQTVFIDFLYRRIEGLVEGNYIQQRQLQKEHMSLKKIFKFSTKWLLFAIVSSLIAHSFIAYFAGSKELLQMMQGSPEENWNYFLVVSFVTAILLFDFGWFREQFCVIMCPYGRIQSVLLDSNSMAVVYDAQRGEPRRGTEISLQKRGDCVSCNRCVEVCPTGIDIRHGLQMECISCTACIDACDEIMTKIKKPKGLISFMPLDGSKFQFVKAKTIFYAFAILAATSALGYNLIDRDPLNIALLRALEAPYQLAKNENDENLIRNHFRLHLTNQTAEDNTYTISLSPKSQSEGLVLTLAQNPILLKAKDSSTVHLFVHLQASKLPSSGQLTFQIQLISSQRQTFERELTFLGPSQ